MTKDFTHVLYHANCPDGFGAAFFAWLKLGDKAQYIPVSYGEGYPLLPGGSRVLMVDFSLPRELLLEFKGGLDTLVVLDHHKTAQADLEGLDFCTFDMERSGAMLSWNYFHVLQDCFLACYLQDRDLWHWKLPFSREINAAIWSYPKDFKVWNKELHIMLNIEIDKLIAEGTAILRYKMNEVQIQADRALFGLVAGHLVPIVNTTTEFSEVGEELCIRNPDKPFAAYYFDRADGKRQWGLRSRNGFDVSEVAKTYGGGGHKAAAGFTTEIPK